MEPPAPRGGLSFGPLLLLLSYTMGCGVSSEPTRPSSGVAGRGPAEPAPAGVDSPPPYQIEGEDEIAVGEPGSQYRAYDPARVDQTHRLVWRIEPEDRARVDRTGYVVPVRPGPARIVVSGASGTATRPIRIREASGEAPDFRGQILPILTLLGCNAGGCHGRLGGQNGFYLSLYGYDAWGDYHALTRHDGGRRIDSFDPGSSLLIRKATGRLPHGGGRPLEPGSEAEQQLIRWIAAGAPGPSEPITATPPRLQITVSPAELWQSSPGPVQLRVLARSPEGRMRDVTRWAIYRTLDERVASVDPRGRVDLRSPGQADIVVRFGPALTTTRVSLRRPGPPAVDPDVSGQRWIDRPIIERLARLNIPVSPPASDAAFLRRVSLDLTGQTPEPDEIQAFLADPATDKRLRKIDELMGRREFVDFWVLKLGDLLQISRNRLGDGAGAYHRWLQTRLRENAGWDVLVRELLTALGDPLDPVEGGPVNYALDGATPAEQAELAARRFLGLRLRCAQCHDHPFDVWTQEDYYGLAAFFAWVERPSGGLAGGSVRRRVVLNPGGAVTHPRTGQPVRPRFLDGTEALIPEGVDPRRILAEWMTSAEHLLVARAAVNWAWAQLFGRGLVDPPDDLSAANPPSHPDVLEALARQFAEQGFDLRWLIREIVRSDTYGRSSQPVPGNEWDDRLFSHHLPRPLTAHQLADALARATQVPHIFKPGQRIQPRAIEVFDPATPSMLLDAFGRCSRLETCSPIGAPEVSLNQALMLIGGDVVEGRVAHINGYLAHALEEEPEAGELVEFLYLRALCRPPTDAERSHWTRLLEAGSSRRDIAEDLFWALLNCREFAFNH